MTEPIHDIIPREINDDGVKNLMNQFSNSIDETVNFGSHILKWDLDNIKGGDENLPIVLSFRHFLELIDSISILIKQSSVDPCNLLLRGALETYFGLEYIFEKYTLDRSMAFLAWNAHNNMKVFKKYDKTTELGKQFQEKWDKDKLIRGTKIPDSPLIIPAIENLENLLRRPEYQKVEKEFLRLKKNKEPNPNWYRLFNGPKNIQELANHLKLSALYEVLYRPWSGQVHGTEVIQGKYNSTDKNVEIYQIRFPKDVQSVTGFALTLSILTFSLYINNRIPSRKNDFTDWYKTIREFHLKINSNKQLFTFK